MIDFAIGSTITRILGVEQDSAAVYIVTDRGTLTFAHGQDCCSMGYLEEYEGNPEALVGATIAAVELKTSDTEAGRFERECRYFFWEVRTTKGDLWMRWYGDSGDTGMYSDEVSATWGADEPPFTETVTPSSGLRYRLTYWRAESMEDALTVDLRKAGVAVPFLVERHFGGTLRISAATQDDLDVVMAAFWALPA